MWIRNQNKRLLMNVDTSEGIRLNEYPDECWINLEYCKASYDLGRYSSKEKALKVLNEIQHTLSDSVIINGKLYTSPREVNEQHTTTSERIVIYQMPQDEDVEVWLTK